MSTSGAPGVMTIGALLVSRQRRRRRCAPSSRRAPGRTCAEPVLTIGSMVSTRPSVRVSVRPGVVDAGDVGRLVQAATDPVAHQLGAHRVPARAGLALDGGADHALRRSGARDAEGLREGVARGGGQAVGGGPGPSDADRDTGVGIEAVELGGDVELDQIALAQPARCRGCRGRPRR